MQVIRHLTALVVPAVLAVAVVAVPAAVRAQGPTTGVLEGSVRTAAGVALSEVQVTVRPLESGLDRHLETDAAGRFAAPLLPPGEYEVLAEQLGFQPALIGPVPVRAGRHSAVRIALERVGDGRVEAPERVAFEAALVGGSRPGRLTVVSDWERAALPRRDGEVAELLGAVSEGEPALEIEGLPAALSIAAVDGMAVPLLHDRSLGTHHGLPGLLFPIETVAEATLLTGRQDIEWPSAAGATLALTSRSGPRELGGAVDGYGTADALSPGDVPGFINWRAGLSGGGSVAGDSAHVRVDLRGFQRDRPITYVPASTGGLVESLAASGVELGAIQGRRVARSERVSAAAAFDWGFADGRAVRLDARYAEGRKWGLIGGAGVPVPGRSEGSDMLVSASAVSGLAEGVDLDVRLGFMLADRSHTVTGPVATRFDPETVTFAPAGLQLGGDADLPTGLRRSAIDGQATVHVQGDDHHIKGGAAFTTAWHERSRAYGRQGRYLFSGAGAYDAGTGAYFRTEGGATTTDFTYQEYSAFLQDTWRLAPGLDLTTGLRYELDVLPTDRLLRNRDWEELTGIDNTRVARTTSGLDFSAGFEWDVQERHRWVIRAGGGVQTGDVLPEVLAEGLTHDGRIEAFAMVGDVDTESGLVGLGPRLTVLAPSLEPPTTARATFGLTRALDASTALHLGAVLRQTENLPRRTDLNLRPDPAFSDQYGRPVHGPLEQAGRILQAAPGENRRFGRFEAVSTLSTDASSTYWGVTAAVERQTGDWARFVTRYTYSRTRDDWVDPAPGLSFLPLGPFPAGDELGDWREGTSHFDIPHRAAAILEVRPPAASMVAVGAAARASSGRPFTPGMGAGVDANADGVSGNDPAFVDADLDGMQPLLDAWNCLRSSVGRFVERNSCRLPTRVGVDAWLSLRWPATVGVGGEVRIEALGLVADGDGLYDTALLGVDPAGTVEMDPATGEITVPVMVNPRFGRRIIPGDELRRLRISMRLWF